MRIISGALRHRQFQAPAGAATRPTSDRLRETLFNILGAQVENSVFVDAFAGSGAVGIEAYSRKASAVVWIESKAAVLRVLRDNLARLGIGSTTVIPRPVLPALSVLEQMPATIQGCDYFFLDPPYDDTRQVSTVLAQLDRRTLLVREGTCIVVESRRGAALFPGDADRFGRLRIARRHRQGDSQLTFIGVEPQVESEVKV